MLAALRIRSESLPRPTNTGHAQHKRAASAFQVRLPSPFPNCVQVRLSFEVEILCKESCTGALLAPHAPLLLKAMESQGSIAENHREGLRQGLVRALARLSNEELRPHVESLRMLMEREEAEKVRLEMIKLPECILSLCSKTVRWLADVRPSS